MRVRCDVDPPEGVVNFQNQADWNARVGQFDSFDGFELIGITVVRLVSPTISRDGYRAL